MFLICLTTRKTVHNFYTSLWIRIYKTRDYNYQNLIQNKSLRFVSFNISSTPVDCRSEHSIKIEHTAKNTPSAMPPTLVKNRLPHMICLKNSSSQEFITYTNIALFFHQMTKVDETAKKTKTLNKLLVLIIFHYFASSWFQGVKPNQTIQSKLLISSL